MIETERKVYNQDKTEIIENPNLEYGYLSEDTLQIGMTEKVDAVEEQGHWVTIAEYPNGGKDVEWVVTVAGVEASEPEPVLEDILIYTPYYTNQEIEEIEKGKIEMAKFGHIWEIIGQISDEMAMLQIDLTYIFAGGELQNVEEIKQEYIALYNKKIELEAQIEAEKSTLI